MKGEKVQPTPISKDEYVRFKQWVQDTHGTVRGHLSTEIENALREYRQPDSQSGSLQRIEDDIATIKAQLATAESDGGTDICDVEPRAPADDGKPRSNAPRSKKVEWFINEKMNREGGEITVGALKSMLKSEFGFSDGVVSEYVDMVIADIDAERHPEKDGYFMWGDRIERFLQERRDAAEEDVEQFFGESK